MTYLSDYFGTEEDGSADIVSDEKVCALFRILAVSFNNSARVLAFLRVLLLKI
ncbi:hypothetical protein [Arcticibacterium luteifluviistationis]|uniref:hypothetical protein n=1 Tax=Arcticibacterium luteifluviistationis TaxID=1784714 RepID=UPI0013A6E229|nr:hypothetical protein [Arcticibacterium luteifluviistationis]